jgi:septum formation protein
MLILASSSPRRRELLAAAQIAFTVESLPVDESPIPGESPTAYAMRLAHEKAQAVFARHPQSTVLGADTIVVCDDHILGKPADAADAARMLRQLSARAHQVTTAVALISPRGTQVTSCTTTVSMRSISEEEIKNYIATNEPMDKAGAYAIQGGAAPFITSVDGDYQNVVGLPVALVRKLLAQA